MKQINKEEFIKRAKEIHGNKYDYSKVNYVNNNTKVSIICPKHGEFWQTPSCHLSRCGCPICGGRKKLTKEEFIERAKEIHGNKYNYSKVNYVNNNTKVSIICPKHGEFWQNPHSHLSGSGCPICGGRKKLTKEEFIERAKEIHGNKYDYSKVEYKNTNNKICIVCPKHGEFTKTVMNHLLGQGCPICSKEKSTLTTKEFIERAKEIHGNKYNYSKVNYIKSKEKVCIICPKHGEFWQTPSLHVSQKCGCPKCSNCQKLTTKEFIERAKEIHGNKYDYSKVEYKNSETKVCIICPIHGEFWQTPNAHLIAKHKCPKCSHPSTKLTTKEFIERAIEIHGNKYDYSKVEYVDNKTKVCIICPKHGEFWQTPSCHLKRCGCPNCSKNKKMTTEDFIKKASVIQNNFYDYSKVEYKNTETKVCIICPEHGEFWQTPHCHLTGVGCPLCSKVKNINETSLYEFINANISEKVIREKHFPWLGAKSLDIYIPKYNIGIEYQGVQHFKALDFFGGEKSFKETLERDRIKYNLCKLNDTKLFYFSKEKDLPKQYFDKIYTNENVLLETIKKIRQ